MGKLLISCCCLLLLSSVAYPQGKCIDDFENGNADGWKEVAGDWEVQDGAYVQLGMGNNVLGIPRTIIQSPWEFSEGTIEATIEFDRRSDGTEIPTILYRMIDENSGYAFRLQNDRLEVGKFQDGQYQDIRGDAQPIDIGRPARIKLDIQGIFTKVYYNDEIKSRIGDLDETFEKGKIGIAVFDANQPVYFDDIIISGPGIYPFPPLSHEVMPVDKLTSLWGQIKAQ